MPQKAAFPGLSKGCEVCFPAHAVTPAEGTRASAHLERLPSSFPKPQALRVEVYWRSGQGTPATHFLLTNRKGPSHLRGFWCLQSPKFLFMFVKLLISWVSSVCGPIGSCKGRPTCLSLMVSGWAFFPALLGPVLRERTQQPPEEAALIFSSPVALTPRSARLLWLNTSRVQG